MKRPRPGILSVRAVNQYRRRDVLTYLGLRFYLENSAARTDNWARRVASDLVLTRTSLPYFRVYHFKEATKSGGVEHRPIFLPGANEALAEAALLDECANHPFAFENPRCVFSYELSRDKDRTGVFQHYIGGLRGRHSAIAEACEAFPDGVVRYTDIKRFYPTVTTDLALGAWKGQSALAGMTPRHRELGEKLITEHGRAAGSGNEAILTGPMFSHLLANLALRELDNDLSANLPARYIRYVDDIILVGDRQAVKASLSVLQSRLSDLGLHLHDDSSHKTIEVPTIEWLEGRHDFCESRQPVSWMTLIGDLKRYLLLRPEERENLQAVFRSEGFRIPVHDYRDAAQEASFLENVLSWARLDRFRRNNQSISTESLLGQARCLRKSFEEEFRNSVDGAASLGGFSRKRRVPKLRYCAGRLIYLAPDNVLADLSPMADELPELHFHSKVMQTVATGNLDHILHLGTNAAQAAAQPLRCAAKQATTSKTVFTEEEEQALAVVVLNGVQVDRPHSTSHQESELLRFATSGSDLAMMKDGSPFIRELSCLHGLSEVPRHADLLELVFDEDEILAMDAIEQLQQSSSA